MILDNLDAELKQAVEKVNRGIGQRVRYAKEAQRQQYQHALLLLDMAEARMQMRRARG